MSLLHGLAEHEVVVFLLQESQTCDFLVVARREVDFCLGSKSAVLLASPNGRHRFTLVDIAWQEVHRKLVVGNLVAVLEIAKEHPAWVQVLQASLAASLEIVRITEVAREFILCSWFQSSLFAYSGYRSILGKNLWPAILPSHRQQIGVASGVVHIFLVRTTSQEHCPPIALAIFYDVGMSGRRNRVLAIRVETCALGKDRVVRVLLPRSHRVLGTEDDLAVPTACTALGAHQIVELALLEEMRSFYPNWLRLYVCSATEHFLEVALDGVALHVELEATDRALSLVVGTANYRTIVYNVALAIVVEEEAWVDAVYLRQVDRFAPTLLGVFALYKEIASPHIGGNHIEGLVLLVVADGRSEDAARNVLPLQRHLRFAAEHVARWGPVHQVLARGERHAREEGER